MMVRLRCLAPDGVCRGRVRMSVGLRSRKGSREVRKLIGVVSYSTRAGRTTAKVQVTVPAALRRRIRSAARRVAVVTATPAQPSGRRTVLRRRLARPR